MAPPSSFSRKVIIVFLQQDLPPCRSFTMTAAPDRPAPRTAILRQSIRTSIGHGSGTTKQASMGTTK